MTMHARRRPRGESRGDASIAFVEQVTAEETAQLHCLIPESLHHKFRIMAAERRTTMTALVIEALSKFAEHES